MSSLPAFLQRKINAYPFTSKQVSIRVVCIVLLIAATVLYTSAQPKVIPPSPNAFAFQKYTDIPVSTYIGVPSITVPLYLVNSGDISIPINLSYHASGIKVADEASNVGLGWVISSGSMISRNILGNDDFIAGNGLQPYHNTAVPELGSFNFINALVQWGCELFLDSTWVDYSIDYNYYDSEPDQYYYSLPNGKSGKFILKRNRSVIIDKGELIDIKLLNAEATRWQIRTPDGFIYEFLDKFESHYSFQPQHKTAWYLTKIISPSKQTVTFDYSIIDTRIQTVGSVSQIQSDGAVWGGCAQDGFISNPSPGQQYNKVQLNQILFDEGAVEFKYSPRQDLQGDGKLDSLIVYEKTGSNPVTYGLHKKIALSYEYFEGYNDMVDGTPTPYEAKRLKLKYVQEFSKKNKKNYRYKFEYNNEYTNETLPSKLSYARDHWGYYNGRDANSILIPTFTPALRFADPFLRAWGMMGSERDPSAYHMGLFSLKRIWYPTGGFTDIELEAHDFDAPSSAVNEITTYDFPPTERDSKDLNYEGDVHRIFPANFIEADTTNNVLDFRDAVSPEVKVNIFFRFNTTLTSCPYPNDNVTFRLLSENGQEYASANLFQAMNGTPPNAACSGFEGFPGGYDPAWQGITYTNTYSLPPGRYYWELYIAPNVTMFADVHPTFSYYKLGQETPIAGGLRVKRILTYETPAAPPQVTRYDYGYMADLNVDGQMERHSNGKQMARPNYSYFEPSAPNGAYCESIKRTSESTIPLAGGGSSVGYSRVTVFNGENGENGKSIFVYHNEPDEMLLYHQMVGDFQPNIRMVPRRPPFRSTLPDPLNGTLKFQYDFRYVAPNVFDTVRTVTNKYVDAYANFNTIIWGVERRALSYDLGTQCNHFLQLIYPSIKKTWVNLESTVEKTFNQLDQAKTSRITAKYFYENPTHFQLTREEKYLGEKTIVTKLKYPLDYLNLECSPAVFAMKNLSFFQSPVIQKRTEQLIDNTLTVTGQAVTTFDFSQDNAMILPVAQATLLLAKPALPASVPDFVPINGVDNTKYRTDYMLEYDNDGNVISIKKPNDMPVSYYWSYQKNLPVAEVKNATPKQIFHTSFEDLGEGNSNEARTGHKSSTSGLSVNLTDLTAGAYTLTHWKLIDNAWSFQQQEVNITGTTYSFSLTGHVDEVRFYPKGALMTTYTYDPMRGITSATDQNHVTSYYEYDEFNRLQAVRDSNRDIVKVYEYNYKK